jgi:hypothetical protein
MAFMVQDPCPNKCTNGYFYDHNNPDKMRVCGVCKGAGTILHPLDDKLQFPNPDKSK